MQYKRLFVKNTYIFITIVTSKRRKILINNIDILKRALKQTISHFNYEIYAICVLPDHLHMLIKPYETKDYPKIIQQIKRYFSNNIDKEQIENYTLTNSNINRKECDIWQKRYWEHTIRDESDLNKHLDYIHYNPVKHGYVNKAKDWKYSSFKKFVDMNLYKIEWCNFENKNFINKLDYE